jgi:hypothetical protein
MDVSPAWVVSAITTVGAIIAGFWTYKSSRAQAQPNAQDAINEGFTRLAERQDREMEKLAQRVSNAEQKAENAAHLARADRDRLDLAVNSIRSANRWHVRHAATFDQPVIKALQEVAPERAAPLVSRIESDPFPQLPEEM